VKLLEAHLAAKLAATGYGTDQIDDQLRKG
jgi:hypothetical protein